MTETLSIGTNEPIERPRGLEPRYYTDPSIFEAEHDRIFARTWFLVGHVSQVAEPGRLISTTVGRDPVLVIKEVQAAGFEFVDYSDLHFRADDELEYEVGRRSVSGNTDRFTFLFRKP